MGITSWWEFWLIGIPAIIFGAFTVLWAVPGIVFGVVLSLGNPHRIVYIDKQLSKNVKTLHAKPMCMLSANIMSRFVNYSIAYPFIRHRATTDSKKFRAFMWFNTLGFWSFLMTIILTSIARLLGIIPPS